MVNNVIRAETAIKGVRRAYPQFIAPSCSNAEQLRLLEKLFRRRAVRLSALHVRLDARDLGFEDLNALLELGDRHGVEVLLAERDEGIVGLAREKVFQVHGWSR